MNNLSTPASCANANDCGQNVNGCDNSTHTVFSNPNCGDRWECLKIQNKCFNKTGVCIGCGVTYTNGDDVIIKTTVEMSKSNNIKQKLLLVKEAIETLKESTIWTDITKEELFKEPTSEQYKIYFERLSRSALTLPQQKLLLEQITTDFTQENALNLFMNSQNYISRKPEILIDRELLKEIIDKTINTVLINIMLSYQYRDSFLHFNYAGAFQSFYYATSLYLYLHKWPIIFHIVTEYVKNVKK